jgi:hypothetical protein
MSIDIATLLLIALVVILIGLSKSAFAGALGVFAVPLLMLKLTAIDAITLMLPILMMSDVFSLRSFWRQWDTRLLVSLIPGAVIGVAAATLLLGQVNSYVLRSLIGLICIAFALKNLCFKQLTLSFLKHPIGAFLMSGASAISSTLVHAGGPPLIIYFSAIGLRKKQFIATAAAFFAIMNVIKLAGVLTLGLLTMDTVLKALAFVPVALLGNKLGLVISQSINTQQFLTVMNLLLLLLGVWLLST